MIKYFIFTSKRNMPIENIEDYLNINYQGFEILSYTPYFIDFKIDTQSIRKLKLNKLNTIQNNEEKLIQLINNSKEISGGHPGSSGYSEYSGYSGSTTIQWRFTIDY